MTPKQQLLCTFSNNNSLSLTVDYVQNYYKISNNKIFLYKEALNGQYYSSDLLLMYNIDHTLKNDMPAKNTILVHRKKHHNSFYTINALNCLIETINNGVLDKNYQIDWENYKDKLLTLIDQSLKITPIIFQKILYI